MKNKILRELIRKAKKLEILEKKLWKKVYYCQSKNYADKRMTERQHNEVFVALSTTQEIIELIRHTS